MGMGVDLGEVDLRVRRSLDQVTADAEQRFERLLVELTGALQAQMDPGHRSSVVSKVMGDLTRWREDLSRSIDPDRSDSDTARLLQRLDQLLKVALDPAGNGSALAAAFEAIRAELRGLRDDIAAERGRARESEKGTAKGVDFEDHIDRLLRDNARHLGAMVERTSRVPGAMGPEILVGDHVLTLASGKRIVVESKNVRTLDLGGGKGILAELDRAMTNREADVAICVSASTAFPQEVGVFGMYGNRILVVDDGEGSMVWVALRWAVASLAAGAGRSENEAAGVDLGLLTERIQRVRSVCQRFAAQRSALTEVTKSVGRVQETLAEMRGDLVALIDDIAGELTRAEAPGAERSTSVIPLTRQVG
jgi:hypothetical protein